MDWAVVVVDAVVGRVLAAVEDAPLEHVVHHGPGEVAGRRDHRRVVEDAHLVKGDLLVPLEHLNGLGGERVDTELARKVELWVSLENGGQRAKCPICYAVSEGTLRKLGVN